MDDVDPGLAKHWAAKAAQSQRLPVRNGKTVRIPLTQHPAIRQQAMARYVQDQGDAQVAALRVKRVPKPWDLRLLRWTGRLIFMLYARPRNFLASHTRFISAQKREYRLTACRACTFHKDRGDFLVYCEPMLAKCNCPVWKLSGLSWVTRLRKTVCPLGRWDAPEKAADDDEAVEAAQEAEARRFSSGCGGR